MSWLFYDVNSAKEYTFALETVLTIGSSSNCEIQIRNKSQSTIHSQIILDERFIFHIHDEKLKIYYLSGNINVYNSQFKFCYNSESSFYNFQYNLNEIYQCFQSEEFQNILEKIQQSFFQLHSKSLEYKKISPHEFIERATNIIQETSLNSHNVFLEDIRHSFKVLIWCLWARIFEYGILTPSILNPKISEIMVNGVDAVYEEIEGKIYKSPIKFFDESHLIDIIERMCASVGRRIDESIPYCDARLKEGHRIHAILRPLSLIGPCLTIRKFPTLSYDIQSLMEMNSVSKECANILETAIKSRKNILISGGTGSGKTTLLNCLSAFIPHVERVVTIEDSAELQLSQPHVIRLECRHENSEKKGAVSIRDLVRNSLRMRPDRIIVGECRGEEALDMLQAMNTGHSGSMTTVHANSTQDALKRLEVLVMFSNIPLSSRAIREQITSAVHIVVQLSRLSCGRRIIRAVDEVIGFEEMRACILTNNLYTYEDCIS